MVPLSMLPRWMQAVLNFLPFKDIIYTPTMIYMGQYSTGQMWIKIGIQLLWALIMWGLTEWLFSKAIRHISVNGG
jgi:ABC-2 type transport system permease protein